MKQPELGIVDDLGFLALLHSLDGQSQLLAQLLVHVVVEIGDASMQADDRLHHVQGVLARRFLVVDEGPLQLGLAVTVGGNLDPGLTVLVVANAGGVVLAGELFDLLAQLRRFPEQLAEPLALESQEDRRSQSAGRCGMAPVTDESRLTEVIALSVKRQAELFAVSVGRRHFDLALDDDVELAAGIALLVERLVGIVALVEQKLGERADQLIVGLAQQGDRAKVDLRSRRRRRRRRCGPGPD